MTVIIVTVLMDACCVGHDGGDSDGKGCDEDHDDGYYTCDDDDDGGDGGGDDVVDDDNDCSINVGMHA